MWLLQISVLSETSKFQSHTHTSVPQQVCSISGLRAIRDKQALHTQSATSVPDRQAFHAHSTTSEPFTSNLRQASAPHTIRHKHSGQASVPRAFHDQQASHARSASSVRSTSDSRPASIPRAISDQRSFRDQSALHERFATSERSLCSPQRAIHKPSGQASVLPCAFHDQRAFYNQRSTSKRSTSACGSSVSAVGAHDDGPAAAAAAATAAAAAAAAEAVAVACIFAHSTSGGTELFVVPLDDLLDRWAKVDVFPIVVHLHHACDEDGASGARLLRRR